jgi:small subunit ribosomal protein S11
VLHIHASFNNTIVTITDRQGNALAWATSGGQGFRGSRKSTPFAAQVAAEVAGKAALDYCLKNLDVLVKGPGPGRESAVRALGAVGYKINSITDVTPIPHNGCRPPKKTSRVRRNIHGSLYWSKMQTLSPRRDRPAIKIWR